METITLVVHVLAAMSMIGLILLQQGKGAEMGASFGSGASQTLFGAQGSGNFFSRVTAFIAVVFFVTSFALAVIAKEKVSVVDDIGIPSVQEQDAEVPAVQTESESDVPAVNTPEAPASEVPAVQGADEAAEPQAEEGEVPQPQQQ